MARLSHAMDQLLPTMKKPREEDPLSLMSAEMRSKITTESLVFMNFCGISYFLLMTSMIIGTSFAGTLPALYDGFSFALRVAIALYIIFQLFTNFYLVCRLKSPCGVSTDSTLPDGSWRHCAECRHMAPPRSHHCPLCRTCIAERDHHCFFTATCVGHANRRHFVAFCFDCAIGCAYALHVAYQYVYAFHGETSVKFIILPVAIFRWIFGWQSFTSLYFVTFAYACAMTAFGSAGMALWQMFLILRGQTTHEFQSRPANLRLRNICRNIRSVFGPYWLIVFVYPWPVYRLPRNGDYVDLKSI